MRRRLVTIAVFLLAGAVVNVAVAWGCAIWLWPPMTDEKDIVYLEPDQWTEWWVAHRPDGFAAKPFRALVFSDFGGTLIAIGGEQDFPVAVNRVQTGLPLRSAACDHWPGDRRP